MRAVHLRVVELERQLQCRPEQPAVIFAPDDERIVENAAVHAHRAVDFRVHDGGGAEASWPRIFCTQFPIASGAGTWR